MEARLLFNWLSGGHLTGDLSLCCTGRIGPKCHTADGLDVLIGTPRLLSCRCFAEPLLPPKETIFSKPLPTGRSHTINPCALMHKAINVLCRALFACFEASQPPSHWKQCSRPSPSHLSRMLLFQCGPNILIETFSIYSTIFTMH